jgi:hypothetical protein
METSYKFNEKMEVLDLIISVLMQHEKKLDEISNKLDTIVDDLYIVESELRSQIVSKA